MRRSLPDLPVRPAAHRPGVARRLLVLLLAVTTFGGLFLSTNPRGVSADALSDAYALSGKISNTKASLSEINANVLTVKTQIVQMTVEVARSQNAVDEIVATAARLDDELAQIEAEEADKRADLDA